MGRWIKESTEWWDPLWEAVQRELLELAADSLPVEVEQPRKYTTAVDALTLLVACGLVRDNEILLVLKNEFDPSDPLINQPEMLATFVRRLRLLQHDPPSLWPW